ncbi:MAG: UDP-N-acetylglucosamine 2-epimerase [Patescibacteria group bacterium]
MSKLNRKKIILVITGTRAEYGLLKSTIDHIRSSKKLGLKLLATGMHTQKKYGYTLRDINKDSVPVDCVVKIGENDSMLQALSREISGIEKYCVRHRPDIILVLGDRDEAFAGAIVGGHLNIPVAHIHGGDISSGVVDDYIRHAITKFSHLHFTVSKYSQARVLQLGEESWRVYNVGSPGLDNLATATYQSKKDLAKDMQLDPNKPWFVVLQHPTPLDPISIKDQIIPTLQAVSSFAAEKIVIYPNSDTGSNIFIKAIEQASSKKGFHVYKSLPRAIYLSLLKTSDALIGNSSSGIIESGYFKLPTINIGKRQQGRECGQNVTHVGYNQNEIAKAIARSQSQEFSAICKKAGQPYGSGQAGKTIAAVLEKMPLGAKLLDKKFVYAK